MTALSSSPSHIVDESTHDRTGKSTCKEIPGKINVTKIVRRYTKLHTVQIPRTCTRFYRFITSKISINVYIAMHYAAKVRNSERRKNARDKCYQVRNP